MRYCLLLHLLLTLFMAARGQEYSYVHYDIKDGLAASVVYCAAEDKEGFLWFGTESGLSRFDGTHFRNFTIADGLPDNEVLKLFVDSKNRVWIIPFKNSVCYYWKGRIYNCDNDPVLHRLSISTEPMGIKEDRYGNIIIVEFTGIDIIYPNQETKSIRTIGGMPLIIQGGGLNREGTVDFFLVQQRKLKQSITNIYTLNNPATGDPVLIRKNVPFANNATVNTTLLSPALNVFQGSGHGLTLLPAGGRPFNLPLPANDISISKIDDTLFAINTTDGVIVYNLLTGKKVAHFLAAQTVNAVIRDSENNLWFMCAGTGIFRLGSQAFRNFTFPVNAANLPVNSIQKIGDSLFVGTERYLLWVIDPALQKVRKQELEGYISSRGRILVIRQMANHRLLLGTDGGLIKLNNFSRLQAMSCVTIKSITAAGNEFLVSASQMVFLCRSSDLKVTKVLWHNRSTCSYKKDSLFYIGTFSGLYAIDAALHVRFMGDTNPVFKNRIADIKESPGGILWIATCGQGVVGYKNGRVLYLLTEKEGLTSNICRSIAVTRDDVWVGTDKGLNRIHVKDGGITINRFSSADGLASDIINTVYVDSGNVYVGTAGGLTYFNTGKIAASSFCKLRVTTVQTASHTWAYDTSGFSLPRRQNAIRVEFVGISFRSAGDITYRYRLQGLSDDWRTTKETVLSYPTLPPGQYELQLAAVNKFGIPGDMIHIKFSVEKFIWEKTGFILLMIAVVGALLWFFVNLRIRALHRKNQEKIDTANRIAELEQMALKAQMNPHFIFNSLNSIQQYVIDKDFKGVNKFISDFSKLIRLTMEISSKSRITLEDEVKYISTYLALEKSRFENKFSYQVHLSPGIGPQTNYIPPMILQPYVENSIRHGVRNRSDNNGQISIRFSKNDLYLVSTIEDNGVGRAEARKFKSLSPIEYQSRGMALTASRVEMINKSHIASILISIEDLLAADGSPAGTRVTICFPLEDIIKPKSIHHDQGNNYR